MYARGDGYDYMPTIKKKVRRAQHNLTATAAADDAAAFDTQHHDSLETFIAPSATRPTGGGSETARSRPEKQKTVEDDGDEVMGHDTVQSQSLLWPEAQSAAQQSPASSNSHNVIQPEGQQAGGEPTIAAEGSNNSQADDDKAWRFLDGFAGCPASDRLRAWEDLRVRRPEVVASLLASTLPDSSLLPTPASELPVVLPAAPTLEQYDAGQRLDMFRRYGCEVLHVLSPHKCSDDDKQQLQFFDTKSATREEAEKLLAEGRDVIKGHMDAYTSFVNDLYVRLSSSSPLCAKWAGCLCWMFEQMREERQRLSAADEQCRQLEQEVQLRQAPVAELEKGVQAKRQAVEQFQDSMQHLATQCKEAHMQAASLLKALDPMQSGYPDLKKAVAAKLQEADATDEAMTTLRQQLSTAQGELHRVEEEQASVCAQHAAALQGLTRCEEERQAADAAYTKLKSVVAPNWRLMAGFSASILASKALQETVWDDGVRAGWCAAATLPGNELAGAGDTLLQHYGVNEAVCKVLMPWKYPTEPQDYGKSTHPNDVRMLALAWLSLHGSPGLDESRAQAHARTAHSSSSTSSASTPTAAEAEAQHKAAMAEYVGQLRHMIHTSQLPPPLPSTWSNDKACVPEWVSGSLDTKPHPVQFPCVWCGWDGPPAGASVGSKRPRHEDMSHAGATSTASAASAT